MAMTIYNRTQQDKYNRNYMLNSAATQLIGQQIVVLLLILLHFIQINNYVCLLMYQLCQPFLQTLLCGDVEFVEK